MGLNGSQRKSHLGQVELFDILFINSYRGTGRLRDVYGIIMFMVMDEEGLRDISFGKFRKQRAFNASGVSAPPSSIGRGTIESSLRDTLRFFGGFRGISLGSEDSRDTSSIGGS